MESGVGASHLLADLGCIKGREGATTSAQEEMALEIV